MKHSGHKTINKEYAKRLGLIIRSTRIRLQKEVSEIIDALKSKQMSMCKNAYYKRERGAISFRGEELVEIIRLLGIDLHDLLREGGDSNYDKKNIEESIEKSV